MTERVGNRIAVGFGYLPNVSCSGAVQRVRVPTLAQQRPFRVGVAFATGCLNGVDFREIHIVRRR